MTFYRNLVWYYKGLYEYTKSGYEQASKHFNRTHLDVDLTGRSYLITGANSGIGKSLTKSIAERRGTVHMVCRNVELAETAKKELQEETKSKNLLLHIVDLSKPRQVYKFAKNFINTNEKLDVLINNAGCMVTPRQVNKDGFEINFATNTFALHILTSVFQPLLHKSLDARVINVSSGGMLKQKLYEDDFQFEKMKPFVARMAYAQNKRQQVVMTQVYARRDPKVFYSVMHPGWADTPAVRSAMPDFYNQMKEKLRTADQGADTALWLAISEASVNQGSGLFYQDRVAVSTHLPLAWTRNTEAEENYFVDQLDELLKKISC